MTANAHTRPVAVGIDGTSAGLEALALGRVLAATFGAPLVLGAIFGYDAFDAGELVWPPRNDADKWLAEAESRLDASVPWTSVALSASSRSHGLIELAEREGAGVLVLGSSHRATLGQVLAGSTARRVVHGAPCAVAVAPRGWTPSGNPQTIGAAYIDTPEAGEALAMAVLVAERAGARLRAITAVYQPSPAHPMFAATGTSYGGYRVSRRKDAELRAQRALSEIAGEPETEAVVLEGEPVERLGAASAELDLLVVGSRRYGPLRSALLGGVSGPLIEHAACPLLIVPRGVHAAPSESEATGAATGLA